MANVQVVVNGVAENCILVADGATLSGGVVTLPDAKTLSPAAGETYFMQPGAGVGWTVLDGVLVAPVPPAVTLTKDDLVAFANAYQWRLATGGHNVTVGSNTYLFPTDPQSLSLMTGKVVRLQVTGAPTSVDWQLPSGYVTFSASDFITCAAALADWVQSTFEALKPVLASIESGAFTTEAQIISASWPSP